jgi:hypothetical protein
MMKTTKGEVAYWLIGAAGVASATWQFAVMVSS